MKLGVEPVPTVAVVLAATTVIATISAIAAIILATTGGLATVRGEVALATIRAVIAAVVRVRLIA
jgi:hypothetical protein